MSLRNRGNQAISAVAIPLFIGAIIYLTLVLGKNSSLENNVKEGKLTAESLLSEKLLLDKEIAGLQIQQTTLTAENNKLKEVTASHSREEHELRRENQTLKQKKSITTNLKNQLDQQLKTNYEMERNVEVLRDSLQHLISRNEDMLNLLVQSQQENRILQGNQNIRQSNVVNNSLIEVTKRNKKLTITAARTRNITITADVPVESDGLGVKVTSPDGRVISSADGEVAVKVIHADANNPQAFFVAISSAAGRQYKKVEIVYKPIGKLKAGVYTIEVFDTTTSIGSLQVRLR